MNPRLSRWRLGSAVLIPLYLAVPVVMTAQEQDSTAFRAGQWGVEFSLGGSFVGLGAQRFSTPKRAWMASVRGRFRDVTGDTDSLSSSLFDFSLPQANLEQVQLTLGHRWYRSLTDNVLQHVTVGALASTFRETRFRRASPDITSRSIGGGVYAELGAMWMVTQRLSLGAAWTAQATLARSTLENLAPAGTKRRSTSTHIAFGDVRMQGALFF